MSFTLLDPGTRKGNKYWIARVTVDGRRHEVATQTTNKAAARRFAEGIERKLLVSRPPRPGEAVTFRRAVELYCEYRGIDLDDRRLPDARRLRALNAVLGNKALADIRQPALVEVANQLADGRAPATRNREVIRPAAAVLHYASESGYCEWLRVKTFKEAPPVTRAVTQDVAVQLLAAEPDDRKRLLLLWLFRQGTRITQTLSVTWDNISLAEQTFRFYDKKAGKWQTLGLHPEVFEELTCIPQAQRHGRLWPWEHRTSVYSWLQPLATEIGVHFTPHMARHSLGTWLNASGAGLKTIMAALGHTDPKSSLRYQAADIETVRVATLKLAGDLRGKSAESRRKSS